MKKFKVSRIKRVLLALLVFSFLFSNLCMATDDCSTQTIECMWKNAIQCRLELDMLAVPAIQTVWGNLAPEATIQNMAEIMLGVYADTYWNLTKMNTDLLSSHLQQGTSLDKATCDTAAVNANKQWHGVLLRDNSTDTGQIPTQGYWTASFDVVTSGHYPISIKTLLTQWKNYFWNQPSPGKNYMYTRGGLVGFNGKIPWSKGRLFVTDGGAVNAPTDWQVCYTKNGEVLSPMKGMTGKTIISPENPHVASEAFIYSPSSGTEHVCMIATVKTPFFKNDPLSIPKGNWNSVEWITNNGAAAWHNVDVHTNAPAALVVNNLDPRPERFAFEAHCINVPEGTKVSLKFKDPKVTMDTGKVKISRKAQIVGSEVVLPAHYKGHLIATIECPKGKKMPANASVDVRQVWILKHGHKHYMQAVDLFQNHKQARSSQDMRVSMSSFTFIGKRKKK